MHIQQRCTWPGEDPLMIAYHDTEWGVPLFDDRKLFEFVVLDTMQAGLSWRTILHKRENFRKAFDDFCPEKIIRYSDKKIESLMRDTGIIRNRAKIHATVKNAKGFLAVQKEYGSFSNYLWSFVGGAPIVNTHKKSSMIATHSAESDVMSANMKRRGFSFVGTTICYAFMQGAGLVNDHLTHCFRHTEVQHAK